ncbi:PP2C family protein-serine/threonine phosphatase [Undibacterium arcticum]|uniref:PP2C family protein-serine/threonine phosphatase n=1 Tax=Undibacterium arcticum TaxID=1762892 RepID=UPI003615FDA2
MSQYKIEAGTGQHIGNRQEQQDRTALFAAARAPGYMMAVLADGMGGRSGGSIAAEQVVRTAQQLFSEFSPLNSTVEQLLETITQETHTIIKLSAMATKNEPHSTMVVLVITPEKSAVWAHVGDSRLYRFSGPNFADHTIDHSYVEKLVSENKITRDEGKNHRLSNILINVLGSAMNEPYVTIGRYDGLKAGDAFLLCSDGLWHYFTNDELGAALAANTPRQASEMLIRKVAERAAGQGDNCTLAIVKMVAPPKEEKLYGTKDAARGVIELPIPAIRTGVEPKRARPPLIDASSASAKRSQPPLARPVISPHSTRKQGVCR